MPPGEDFNFSSRLNRLGVVIVVVVVVVVVHVDGRSLDEEAIKRLPLRTDREVVVFRLLIDGLEPPKEDRCVLGLRAFKRKMSSSSPCNSLDFPISGSIKGTYTRRPRTSALM